MAVPPSPPSSRGPLPPLPSEHVVATPGAVVVLDEAGRVRDRSPRAAQDPSLGAPALGVSAPAAWFSSPTLRRVVHEGAPLDAVWFSCGDDALQTGLSQQLVESMVHQLRGVVGRLVASVDTEEMLAAGPASSNAADTRRREVNRLVDAIASLGHAFSTQGARSPVDLESAMRKAASAARTRGRAREITVRLEGAAQLRRGRTGDEALLQAALVELLSNAVEASPPRGEITVSIDSGPFSVCITIEDEGPGLLPASRGELGAPFATSKRAGLGLGLFIALRAAFLHGGELSLRSRDDRSGTRAVFWLPVDAPIGPFA